MAIEIVSFPMKNGGAFHSFLYVYQRVIGFTSLGDTPRSPNRPATVRRPKRQQLPTKLQVDVGQCIEAELRTGSTRVEGEVVVFHHKGCTVSRRKR